MSDTTPKTLKPWQRLTSKTVYSCRIFSLREDRKRSPRTGKGHDFYVLEAGDWVNIIPLTADEQVVLIRQYRHGVEAMTLEIPGGMVDAEDPSPLHAARREMQEETGYDSAEVTALGAIHPNPAIQANRCHSFVARNVQKRFETHFDTTEETEVVLVPLADIPDLIRRGQITHALVVVAFHWYGLDQVAEERKVGVATVELFEDDEQTYLSWIVEHQDGFVVNTTRSINKNYVCLHRASCSTIRRPTRRTRPEPFTGGGYVKICGFSEDEIAAYLVSEYPDKFTKTRRPWTTRCSKCDPK